MEMKTFNLKIQSINEKGEFEAYGSVSGNVDLVREVVDYGAFKRTLQHKNGKVVLLADHYPEQRIGVAYLTEDSKGLFIKGILNLNKQNARDVYEDMKFYYAHDIPVGFSIGFDTLKEDWIAGIRHLKELKLYEVSFVTFPANEEARLLAVKENQRITISEGKPAGSRGWDETDSSWRYRLRNPDLFIDDSFRSKVIDEGVTLVMGKLKSEGSDGSMTVQSIVFDKDQFPEKSEAQDWLREHDDVTKSTKSLDFNENYAEIQEQRELQNRIYIIQAAFEQVVYETLYQGASDKSTQERISVITKALEDYKQAYLSWVSDWLGSYSSKSINPPELKSGRMFSSANLNQMKEVIKLLQALIEKAQPSTDSGDSHSDDELNDDSADTKSDPETSLMTILDSLDLEIKELLGR